MERITDNECGNGGDMHRFPERFSVKHYMVIWKVIGDENGRQISGSPKQKKVSTHQSESWTLAFVACDHSNFQPKTQWCSRERWVSSPVIPPLFLTHNPAKLVWSLHKEQLCQICDIILISVRRGGTLPAPSPPPLRGPCFQSQR